MRLAEVKKAAFAAANSDGELVYLTSIFDGLDKMIRDMRKHSRKRGIVGKVARAVISELGRIGEEV